MECPELGCWVSFLSAMQLSWWAVSGVIFTVFLLPEEPSPVLVVGKGGGVDRHDELLSRSQTLLFRPRQGTQDESESIPRGCPDTIPTIWDLGGQVLAKVRMLCC